MITKIAIGRYPEGVMLNEREYVLNEDNTVKLFDTVEAAQEFLLQHGVGREDLDYFLYEERKPDGSSLW